MEIRWLEAARFDIDEIYSHIEADDPRAADKVFGRMIAAVQALGDLPHRGRPGRWPGTRELVVPRTRKAVEKADAGGPFVSHEDAARYLKALAPRAESQTAQDIQGTLAADGDPLARQLARRPAKKVREEGCRHVVDTVPATDWFPDDTFSTSRFPYLTDFMS